MSAPDIRVIASIPIEQWRNGGGITRTFATSGDDWRVSLAEVERDGPYSRFAGMSRLSLILRGNGVMLSHADSKVQLKPYEAVEYDGETGWDACLVDGPVTALNVMSRKAAYRISVKAIANTVVVQPSCAAIVVALDSGCSFAPSGSEQQEYLPAGHVMLVNHVERPLQFTATANIPSRSNGMKLPILVTIESKATWMND
jgi:uncharacterized protein